jgi:hypothetical protein
MENTMKRALSCLLCLAAAGQASAKDRCHGVDTALTEARRQAYAPLVAESVTRQASPAEVQIADFLRFGDWIVVGAEVPVADGEGFFFYRRDGDRLRFLDVWGGYADASEAGDVADWAEALGAPPVLAACFASRAVVG